MGLLTETCPGALHVWACFLSMLTRSPDRLGACVRKIFCKMALAGLWRSLLLILPVLDLLGSLGPPVDAVNLDNVLAQVCCGEVGAEDISSLS